MRIVHLNPFYFPYAGGIERRIRSVSQRQAARGHEVHVVTAQLDGTPAGRSMEGAVTVHRLPSTFLLKRLYNPPPVSTPGLGPVLDAIEPDVIDYHFRWSTSYNRAFRHRSCPGIITYHNTYGEGQGLLGVASRINDRLYMRTLASAERVACVSQGALHDLERHGGDPAKLRLSYNAVETRELTAIQGPPRDPPPGPYAVAVGRVVDVKGFDVLVRAWPHVPKDLHLVVCGKGPAMASLQRLAARLGVADRIHLAGWVAEDEKVRLLRGAVAYLHPARFEAFGLSALEAMAVGAPVVAARVGGLPEAVGEAGPLLGHDPAAWADAITRLANDAGARREAAARSCAQAARFDWDRVVDGLEEIYAEARAAAAASPSRRPASATRR